MSEGETFAGIEEKYFRKKWVLRLDLKVSHISIYSMPTQINVAEWKAEIFVLLKSR